MKGPYWEPTKINFGEDDSVCEVRSKINAWGKNVAEECEQNRILW
jgi:hypothetical protein